MCQELYTNICFRIVFTVFGHVMYFEVIISPINSKNLFYVLRIFLRLVKKKTFKFLPSRTLSHHFFAIILTNLKVQLTSEDELEAEAVVV